MFYEKLCTKKLCESIPPVLEARVTLFVSSLEFLCVQLVVRVKGVPRPSAADVTAPPPIYVHHGNIPTAEALKNLSLFFFMFRRDSLHATPRCSSSILRA